MNLEVVDSRREGRKCRALLMQMIPALERTWDERREKVPSPGGFERMHLLEVSQWRWYRPRKKVYQFYPE